MNPAYFKKTRMFSSLSSWTNKLSVLPALWGWKAHIFELALYVGAYFAYLLTRGVVFPHESTALANTEKVISLEKSLRIFWEPVWQAWAIDHARGLVIFLNWAYLITYLPMILTLALVLYIINRQLYSYYRKVIFINLALALLIFMLFPLAPPLKVPEYFVDTIRVFGPSFYEGPEMAMFRNTNAAMPSQHFGWTVILGVLYLRRLKWRFKLLGLIYPAMTFFAITITGNHYILDAVGGGLLAGVAFAVTELGLRRRFFLPRWWPSLRPLLAGSWLAASKRLAERKKAHHSWRLALEALVSGRATDKRRGRSEN